MPRRVSPQTDPQHEVLRDIHLVLRKRVRGHVVQQQTRVRHRAVVAVEHVLHVSWVAAAPRLVGEGVDAAAAVVALVEGDGYETFLVVAFCFSGFTAGLG